MIAFCTYLLLSFKNLSSNVSNLASVCRSVIFGLLTDNNVEQSRARSGGNLGNKGVEAAVTAIKMIALQRSLES